MAKEKKTITEKREGGDKAFKWDGIEGKKDIEEGGGGKAQYPLAERKSLLDGMKKEDERLCAEEDARGFVDGRMVTARKVRKAEIASIEHEIKTLEEGYEGL